MKDLAEGFNKRQLSIAEICQNKKLECEIPLVQIYLAYATLQNSYLHPIQFQNPKISRDRLTKQKKEKVGSGVQGA